MENLFLKYTVKNVENYTLILLLVCQSLVGSLISKELIKANGFK